MVLNGLVKSKRVRTVFILFKRFLLILAVRSSIWGAFLLFMDLEALLFLVQS